ncbi:GNAT family N-acetyltransferase [Marinilactibacillus psychrotolerans]|uniref:GNAT family N-acetyltransferase n=1 Tax=Marinilactibacillus psychrotolerans TaxID=191770 RepID=A0ABW8UMC4_9LACT|nr:GNAT family N-acetyltransferase [Marinilactibacillus psychrotolerans]
MKIVYKTIKNIEIEQLNNLYESISWLNYVRDPSILEKMILNTRQVFSAWDKEELVGLARVVGEEADKVYIQDILVKKDYQGGKIEYTLLKRALEKNAQIPQKILLTESSRNVIRYCRKEGFTVSEQEAFGLIINEYSIKKEDTF